MINRLRSLKKIHQSYYHQVKWYNKKKGTLTPGARDKIENLFLAMEEALQNKDKAKANEIHKNLEALIDDHEPKKWWNYPLELMGAITFALVVAIIVRQSVFEPYEIPSGSMRPTFEEHDHLVVSKTTFGVNVPLDNSHFYFDPDLVERGKVFIFSGQDVDLPDTDDRLFWVFPAKKRYIKRNMGKPGDSVYFYGGLIYAVDENGNDLKSLREPPFNTTLDHVPFVNFNFRQDPPVKGKGNILSTSTIKLMNHPVARINLINNGTFTGEVFNGKRWVKENPQGLSSPTNKIENYGDFLGVNNFAMARLLNKEQVKRFYPNFQTNDETPLYLQLGHHPYLETQDKVGFGRAVSGQNLIGLYTTLLPLDQQAIDKLRDNLYTARFVVENQMARRYGPKIESPDFEVSFPNVPDGTYEFYFGKGYRVGFGGVLQTLPEDHPLNKKDLTTIQRLYNFGIEQHQNYNPNSVHGGTFPHRYGYFRDGDFYTMGGKIYDKNDPLLSQFVEKEKEQKNTFYPPFIDKGAPLKENGEIDVEKIRTLGFTLPEKGYLALGDNHAMSGDSRHFGPVMQGNIEGSPVFILWPPQKRWGNPNSGWSYSVPTLIIWAILMVILLILYFWKKKKMALPLFKK